MIKDSKFELLNPGAVMNSASGEHCVHACFQMIFRTLNGGGVPSFSELDLIMKKEAGKYTWEHILIASMPSHGFDVKIIWTFDLESLVSDTATYLLRHYGDIVGQETIDNSNLDTISSGARALLHSGVSIDQREPNLSDLELLINEGYYLTVTINQRILQADPGYVAHNIFIYGYSDRGPIFHNPGPPSTQNTEITWDLFDRAWAFPDGSARNIMAFKPRR